jgi:hypothetical protein
MSETIDRTKDEWVGRVLGLDPGGSSKVGALPQSKGKGLGGLLGGKSKAPPLAWDALATTPPAKPVTLKSKCELSKPGSRSRTTLGVGERVELTASEGGGAWTTTAGTLSADRGKKVTLTAPGTAGTATVTIDVAGSVATLDFTVIAPNSVSMVLKKGEHAKVPWPNAKMQVRPHIGPDTVNFGNVEMLEDDVAAVATGYWSDFNGIGHSPNSEYIGFTTKVVSGKGTAMGGVDNVASGYIEKDPRPTDWTGQLSFDILWRWKCGSGSGVIGTVLHVCASDAAGKTTMTKAGATYSAKLSS